MSEEIKHHRLSMSQWTALAVCPHFVPTKKPSPEADAGTAAHKEAADIYAAIQDSDCPEEAFAHEGEYPQAAWCAYNYRLMQTADIPEGVQAACAVEMKLTIQDTDPLVDGIYGYADFVRLERWAKDNTLKRIVVADFKTFSDGTRNFDEQLAGYAVAVASTIPDAGDDTPVELVTLHGLARKRTVSATTLGECRRVAVDVVLRYLCKDRFPKAVNPKCKYCAHYPCEGAVQLLAAVQPRLETLRLSAADMDADPKAVPVILATLEEVEKLIDATKANAAACIKKHGEHSITKDGLGCWTLGDDDCRYEVRESLGSRKMADAKTAWDALIEKSQLMPSDLLECCTMSVGKVTAAIRKKSGLTPKEAGAFLDSLNIVARGKTSESLKRTA